MKQVGTLSRKIVFSFTIISVTVLIIIFGTLERINKKAFYAVEYEKATIIADTVEPLLALNIYLELKEKKNQLVEQLISNPNILAVNIYEGDLLINSVESKEYQKSEQNFFVVQKDLILPNSTLKVGRLELIYSSKRYQELIKQYTQLVIYLLFGLGIIFLLLGLYIRNLLSPLKKIAKLLRIYTPDRKITFPYADENNEIGIISGALNQMHATVHENFMLQKKKNLHLAEQVDEKEQIIYEANQRFKEVFNNTVFGIWVIDKNRNTIDANGKLLEILGYKHDDFVGIHIEKCVAQKDLAFFDRMSVLSENNPDKLHYEVSLIDSKGQTFPAYFHASAVRNRDNQIIGAFSFVEDLREKRLLQAELERKTRNLEVLNEKLEEEVVKEVEKRRKSERRMYQQSRLAAMGQLIVAISHNWRNPLASLGLLIQDVEDAYEYGELNKEYIHDATKKSLTLIEYMSQTIDDFGNFFKPVGEQGSFFIGSVVDKTIHALSDEMAEHGITLREKEGSLDFELFGYPDELQKVMENLINNAKDAITDDGERHVENGEITVSYAMSDKGRQIVIADNGGGIPENILDKVFDPYFTTKDQGKGTGLGLYMAKVIIENNMNGKMSVRNGKEGAEFIIEL